MYVFDNLCLHSHFVCISETTLLQKLARNVAGERPLCVLRSVCSQPQYLSKPFPQVE